MSSNKKTIWDARYKYYSLFCGCGGFDLGFSKRWFNCIGAYDINPIAVSNYNHNIDSIAHVQDLAKNITLNEYADVILSGPPCQGFSNAGKRNVSDQRNSLFFHAIKIAANANPKVFILENVPGILKGNFKEHFVEPALESFHNHGYETHILKINCLDLGMAQMRGRVFLIAWNTGKKLKLPRAVAPSKNLSDVIGDISPDDINQNLSECQLGGKGAIIASFIKPGQKLSNVRNGKASVHTWDIPAIYGKTTTKEKALLEEILSMRRKVRCRRVGDADPVDPGLLKNKFPFEISPVIDSLVRKNYLRIIGNKIDLTHTFNGKYRKLEWDKPCYTVDTRFGNASYFIHPSENRSFTVREAARIQGFPDSYKFFGSKKEQYMLIGNAVPPPLSHYVSKIVLSLLKEAK